MSLPARHGNTVPLSDAKTHLSELVERAANGEVITITRRGKPGCQLVPLSTSLVIDGAKIHPETLVTIDAAPVNRSKATRKAPEPTPMPSKLAPQPPGLTLADILKASR